MKPPSGKEIGYLQGLVIKNPLGFVAAFGFSFLGFAITFIVLMTRENAGDWKKLYESERAINLNLTNQIMNKNGIIGEYREVAKKADSVITETQTSVKILKE